MLKTTRLELVPLNSKQLKLLINDLSAFERDFRCSYKGENLSGELYKIFKNQIHIVEQKGKEYIWCTFWMMVDKQKNAIIGSLGFKDIPDKNGNIEIGYGIGQLYEGKGYTTEAVNAIIYWALKQPSVFRIIAEVAKDNFASQRVLEKCNMKRYKTTEKHYWYFITKNKE